jgi:GntR family transcriptional repressor for pyruvate dehydrogenase complex
MRLTPGRWPECGERRAGRDRYSPVKWDREASVRCRGGLRLFGPDTGTWPAEAHSGSRLQGGGASLTIVTGTDRDAARLNPRTRAQPSISIGQQDMLERARQITGSAKAERDIAPRSVQADMFSKVTVGRNSETIVEQIRQLMRQGQLRPGDRLPAERDLCEQFGVNRVTVRESLRVLECSGLVEIRVGARGGAFLTVPGSGRIADGLADMLSLSVIRAADVADVLLILEIGMVPLLCERATSKDLEDLEQLCAHSRLALRKGDYSTGMSGEFHVRVARATHNSALAMLVESFRRPILMSMEQVKATAPEIGKLITEEHEQFVAAVRKQDPEKAKRIMCEHLSRTAHGVGR